MDKFMTYQVSRRRPITFVDTLHKVLKINSEWPRQNNTAATMTLWKLNGKDYIYMCEVMLKEVPEDKYELDDFVNKLLEG
ncbi:hypothetical protein FDI69_gp234 [Rhodococcus phage Trina]|uniref:Uncharacterized protein n=1 Tax=Rhodococcus phage Trina TaxID=2027905 RepID=A0A2D1A2A8_9CAUD|nr:hypothetical protein FDI69_gp234 [Rhodococcus phage Trina]ASZ74952.1 hypothetical protein SEA_TRINA_155 [Rhodococcus phage Trina]